MDPFDEFEFKPLTEGLGFHKKAVTLRETPDRSAFDDDELTDIPSARPMPSVDTPPSLKKPSNRFEDVLSALEKAPLQRSSELEFTETLPRETPTQSPFPKREAFRQPTPGADVIKPSPKIQSELNKVGTRRGAADSPPPARRLQAVTMSIPSAFLDLVIISALALVFLTSLLTVTKVDLNVVMRNLSADVMTQLSLGVMFIAVMQMYVVIARSFFGRTLGEWTFDLQVGRDEEQALQSYPFRVAARSLLVTITGFFFLPLISAILGRDLPGSLCGAQLYRQV